MINESLIAELTQEAVGTRRAIERIPESKLTWKPHAKSMTVGQLGLHIATLPIAIADLVSELRRELPNVPRPQPSSVAEILATLDKSVPAAIAKLSGWDDKAMMATWTLTREGTSVMQMPRMAVIRTIMFNHAYHHRGQLTVYLRLLDVPVPSIYGGSADEAPPF